MEHLAYNTRVIAPGRVNIIGEHVDYCKFPVLPMALDKVTTSDFKFESDTSGKFKIYLTNKDPEKYPDFQLDHFDPRKDATSFFSKPIKWQHYVLAGFTCIVHTNLDTELPSGSLYVCVDSTVPAGAGLSSSSSVVVGSAMVMENVYNKFLDKPVLAEKCAEYERFVGMPGGGMDQAICILGQKNNASLIDFYPSLSQENVKLPEDASMVVIHTGVEKHKAQSNDFSERVVSTRYAAKFLSEGKDTYLRECYEKNDRNFSEMKKQFIEKCPKEALKMKDLIKRFGKTVKVEDFDEDDELKVFDRGLHVIEESERVYQFKNSTDMKELGRLMNESQRSLKNLYECSCPELDEICERMIRLGAYGARLTGAGWGGCAIALVNKSDLDTFVEKLKQMYPKNIIFGTSPAQGARTIKLE